MAHSSQPMTTVRQPAPGTAPRVGHLVGVPVLLATAVALLILTWLTVAAKSIDLGPLNLYIAMFIAVIKAALVCLFFMHLKYDRPFNSIVFIASVLFLALFLWLAVLDTITYRSEMLPPTAKEFAPNLTRFKQ